MPGRRQRCYTVSILGGIIGSLYVGITNDLVRRVRQHRNHTFGGFTEGTMSIAFSITKPSMK
jgi:predicted GIY-YIG superfamily endonuclease